MCVLLRTDDSAAAVAVAASAAATADDMMIARWQAGRQAAVVPVWTGRVYRREHGALEIY